MLTPTVLVPGITTVASSVFPAIIAHLESIGIHGFRPLDLPSVDPSGPLLPNALEADIAAIRAVLLSHVDDKGEDVVLVGHSYGGAPCLAAAEGLWKTTREREGKKGGVVKVALMAAAIILTGEGVGPLREEAEKEIGVIEGPPPDIEMTEKGLLLKPTDFATTFFTDLPEPEAKQWESTLRPSVLDALMSPAPAMDPKEWNISYLLTESDKVMPILGQEFFINRTRKAGAKIEVERINADHFPFLSHVEETALWIKAVMEV